MLKPFQYATGMQQPQTNFNVRVADQSQALAGLSDRVMEVGAVEREKEAVARAETAKQQALDKYARMKKDMQEALATDDLNIINNTVAKHAEFKEAFKLAEKYAHKNERTLNNSQELSYAYIMAETPEEREALVEERIRVMNEEGVPQDQRQQTEEFLAAHYEGDVEDAKKMLHKRLMISDNDRYNKFLENNGLKVPESAKPATPTDIDDYVEERAAQYELDEGKKATPGMRADWRIEFKREQAQEAYSTAHAEGTAKADTAQRIAYEKGLGEAFANINTVSQVQMATEGQTPEMKRNQARTDMSTKLRGLGALYGALDEMGAMVNIEKGTAENIMARLRASDTGRFFGKAMGTNEEQLRSSVDKIRPLLIQDIRKASEMGTRGLDSEKELAFYMNAVTDVGSEITTNMAALAMLDEVYGNGDFAQEIRNSLPPEYIDGFAKAEAKLAKEGKAILDGRDTPVITTQEEFDALPEGHAFYEEEGGPVLYKPITK